MLPLPLPVLLSTSKAQLTLLLAYRARACLFTGMQTSRWQAQHERQNALQTRVLDAQEPHASWLATQLKVAGSTVKKRQSSEGIIKHPGCDRHSVQAGSTRAVGWKWCSHTAHEDSPSHNLHVESYPYLPLLLLRLLGPVKLRWLLTIVHRIQ